MSALLSVRRFGSTRVETYDEKLVTVFADGSRCEAYYAEQPGQAETAEKYGLTVEAMNRGHDLVHSKLAAMLGLKHSPALWAAAHDQVDETNPLHQAEEAAVLAIQRLEAMVLEA